MLIEPGDNSDTTAQTMPLPNNDSVTSSTPTYAPPRTITIIEQAFLASTVKPISKNMLKNLHDDISILPVIHPTNTAAPCENRKSFESLKLRKLFEC